MPVRSAFIAGLILASLLPMSAFGQAPSIAKGGVLHAADYSSSIAPGAMVSIFGSNLAPATIKASSLPLPSTLSGVSVDVVTSSSTLSAPLYFISPGQINVQLPFDAPVGTVQVRVRTAAGTSNSEPISLIARAPAMFTKNMLGSGEVIAFHADYTAVAADKPAAAGEVIFVYASGLGAVEPAIGAGRAGGDGASGGPLNWVKDPVTVLVGGVASPQVWYAGLAPGFPGVYQINFQIPSSVQAGQYELKVQVAGRTSVAGVTVAGGVPAIKLYDNTNAAGCNLTSTSQFHLDKDAHVASVDTWYHWSPGESSVGYRLSGASGDVSAGTMQRFACDPIQTSWCFAETIAHADLAAGDYTLTMARSQMCANSGSAGQGFVSLYGAWSSSLGGGSSVGPQGATLTATGASVTVPQGAFLAFADLKLSRVDDGAKPPAQVVSGVYKLDGLPWNVKAPIKITLDASGPLPSGKTYVLFKFDGDDETGPMFVEARIENGKIVAELPAMPADAPAAPNAAPPGKPGGRNMAIVDNQRVGALLLGMSGFGEEKSKSGKFSVHYPVGKTVDYDLALKVGDIMDEAMTKLKAVGVKKADQRVLPTDVYLYSFAGLLGTLYAKDSATSGLAESQIWGKQSAGLSLNLDDMKGGRLDYVRTTAGHEFFHVVQNLYDPRSIWRRTRFASPWHWMMDAASTWFEKKMSTDPKYVSENTKSYSDFLFMHGLEWAPTSFGDTNPIARHGYGAAVLLQYFTNYRGDAFVGELFDDMEPATGYLYLTQTYSPVDALYRKETLFWGKWNDFAVQYASGTVNPMLSITELASPPNATIESYTIQNDSTPAANFSWTAPDISARLYRLNLRNTTSSWPAGSKLTVTLTGPPETEVSIWRLGPPTSMIGKTRSVYEIDNADQLAKAGATFFFLVSNGHGDRPYDKTNPITLQVKAPTVSSSGTPIGKQLISVHVDSGGPLPAVRTGSDGTKTNTTQGIAVNKDYGIQSSGASTWPALTWTGNNFALNGTVKSTSGSCSTSQTDDIKGTVSTDLRSVDSATVTLITDSLCGTDRSVYTYNFTLSAIPLTSSGSEMLYEWMKKTGTGHISGLTYRYEITNAGALVVAMDVKPTDYSGATWVAQIGFYK